MEHGGAVTTRKPSRWLTFSEHLVRVLLLLAVFDLIVALLHLLLLLHRNFRAWFEVNRVLMLQVRC